MYKNCLSNNVGVAIGPAVGGVLIAASYSIAFYCAAAGLITYGLILAFWSASLLESVLPAARQQKGYKGGLVLTNPDTGKAEIIALWETEADMTAGEGSGYYREQVAKVAHTLAGPPVQETYKVNNRE